MRTPRVPLRWLALALITAAAGALRLVDLGAVRLDPFYDAAVRSMGLSWHNFFFGAYEPGGSVSIDKPPVDLWLQVASVKLLGWSSTSLKLPEALAGTLSVPLLYAAIKRPFGALAGLLAAAAMAVLPIEVITARSDTMDAVMMLLLVIALWAVVRACQPLRDDDPALEPSRSELSSPEPSSPERSGPRRSRSGQSTPTIWLLVAAVALGLAFNVKSLESLVALPGLLVIVWLGLPRAGAKRRERAGSWARRVAAAGAVYIVVALSWLSATLLFPARERPYAIGSTDGSAWNAAFVFNGTERLTGKTTEVAQASVPARPRGSRAAPTGSTPIAPPSPTRLLARDGQLPASWLGWEALVALLLGVMVVLRTTRREDQRDDDLRGDDDRRDTRRATALGLFAWLLTGIVLFSAMARLHPRYVESFTPAVAGMFGIGVALLANLKSRLRPLAVPLVALLAVPLVVSIEAVRDRTSDAGVVGALNQAEQRIVSSYLRAHQAGARYELAAGAATSIASLIVQDARPVLMLTTYNGLALTSEAQLRTLISRDEVRYALLESSCGASSPKTAAGCAPVARWVRAHGTDVSRQAGLRVAGVLWRLPGAVA